MADTTGAGPGASPNPAAGAPPGGRRPAHPAARRTAWPGRPGRRAARRIGAAVAALELLVAGAVLADRLATGSPGTGSLVAVAALSPGQSRSASAGRFGSVHPPAGFPSGLPGPRPGTTGSSAPSDPSLPAGSSQPSVPSPSPAGYPIPSNGSSASRPGAAGTGRRVVPRTAAATGAGFTGGAPVACATDLPLAQAPDTGYNFLCTQGGAPVTWTDGQLVFYESGLSAVQQVALSLAMVQWAAVARFQVSWTSSPAAADVTITEAPLGAGDPGYVEDGYTTVSYRCDPVCAYFSAQVDLSSTATLLQSDWVATILHELGHVAGLNHVARPGEVMYPYLTPGAPVIYTSGDAQGLDLLAARRGA